LLPQLAASVDPQATVGSGEVISNRRWHQLQPIRDLLVREAVGEKPRDFGLSW